MKKEIITVSSSLYRDDYRIHKYVFGKGEKSLAIVGAMRGNEVQQLYTASLLVNALENAEKDGKLNPDNEIVVFPSLNPHSMNIGKRFYPIDNTDINRMFPGYSLGETTQRIAGRVFEEVDHYKYGIHLASNYMAGEFMSHINIMKTDMDYIDDAKNFGIRFIVLRDPSPYDSTTLNYNWQIWGVKAFSLYTTTTERIDIESARKGVSAVMAFLSSKGIIKTKVRPMYSSQVINNSDIISVRNHKAGFFFPLVKVEDMVSKDQEIGYITDPIDNSIKEKLLAPQDGIVYFLNSNPTCYGQTASVKIIPL